MKKTFFQKETEKMLRNGDINGLKDLAKQFEQSFEQSLNNVKINDIVYKEDKNDSNTMIVANDYYKLILFVLKKMNIKYIDTIDFVVNKYEELDIFVTNKGKRILLDFDLYVHHNDLDQTEMLMEIESLLDDSINKDKLIEQLKNSDWSIYKD